MGGISGDGSIIIEVKYGPEIFSATTRTATDVTPAGTVQVVVPMVVKETIVT
jgi:hypothetical protein